jgi:phage virion morphogenesis protein
MSGPLDALDAELARIAANAGPGERKKLARGIAGLMRSANAKRIRANVTPEGAKMEPRKERSMRPRKLGDTARARRSLKPPRMFAKAPGALVRRATEAGAELGFAGAADRIMAVHQFGLVDAVSRESGAPKVAYPERAVIGLPDADRARIFDLAAKQLLG